MIFGQVLQILSLCLYPEGGDKTHTVRRVAHDSMQTLGCSRVKKYYAYIKINAHMHIHSHIFSFNREWGGSFRKQINRNIKLNWDCVECVRQREENKDVMVWEIKACLYITSPTDLKPCQRIQYGRGISVRTMKRTLCKNSRFRIAYRNLAEGLPISASLLKLLAGCCKQ